jgi:D-aspartate ligase
MYFGAKLALRKKRSVLLASASASGTIGAVRNLGANGFEVGVLSSRLLSAAAWSRWTSRSFSAPPETKSDRFLARVLAIGMADPGKILLPTSDETAWLYTVHADVLKQHFCIYQPSLATMHRILDKKLLADAASAVGLAGLPSWDPSSKEDLEALAPTLPYPILIKPRTHVHRLRNDKGIVVHSTKELAQQYQRYVDRERPRAVENPLLLDAKLPLLQQFVSVGGEGVLSVTGFVDRTGEHFVTRHSIKTFQRSSPVGVGVCFESLPESVALSEAVRRLCQSLGYFGLFEVEFLWFNGSWVIIDFNPRLFNQVALDIRRGMPLPLLACLDATGEYPALQSAVAQAQIERESPKIIFYDRFTLRAILLAKILTGRISQQERWYWRAWTKQNSTHTVHAVSDETDPMPEIIHALSEIYLGLKSFPRFWRSTPRRKPSGISRAPFRKAAS